MSGCFGSSKEDRYFERKLNEYLDSQDLGRCEICQDAQAELQCLACNKEMCLECAEVVDGLEYCPEHAPMCECGDNSGYKCKDVGVYCCGPEKHDCKRCEEGENVFKKGGKDD